MTMEPGHYADPLSEALGHGSQRVAQIASLAAAMAQVAVHRDTLRSARTAARGDRTAARILRDQEHLLREQAKAAWAPAYDRQWLAAADVAQAGRAWAGAACQAGDDPVAAAAMRRCEDRLRELHPYAMAGYDRHRAHGLDPLTAMEQAAPLFARHPAPRPGDHPAARLALTGTSEPDDDVTTPEPGTGAAADGPPDSPDVSARTPVTLAAENFPLGPAPPPAGQGASRRPAAKRAAARAARVPRGPAGQ